MNQSMWAAKTPVLPAFVLPGSNKTNDHKREEGVLALMTLRHLQDRDIKHLQYCDQATIERHIQKLSAIRLGFKVPMWFRNDGRSQRQQGRSEPIRSSIFWTAGKVFLLQEITYLTYEKKLVTQSLFHLPQKSIEICQGSSSAVSFSLKCSWNRLIS